MTVSKELKHVGSRPIRPDGVEKVTGRANFGADENMPGMVVGKVVRSPHAHARIKSIDTSNAVTTPGVLSVITAGDFPDRSEFSVRRKWFNDNILASDKVLYHGHAVAAVAAISQQVADQALATIDVDYEELESVTDVSRAMEADAPILHENMFTTGLEETPTTASNVVQRTQTTVSYTHLRAHET